jgi:uncharacterized protein (DUF2062 family)
MPEWVVAMLVGSIGGLANAYLSEGGFSLPRFFADTQGRRLLDPGFIGGILIGAITAIAFWGLYNPTASFYDTQLEVRPVVGALLAGVGGGRVLSGLVERVITRTNLSRTQEAAERTASTMIGGEDDRTATGDRGGGEINAG